MTEPTHKIVYSLMGFQVETTVEGKADNLKALLKRIQEIGGTPATPLPATAPATEKTGTPKCAQHKSPMKRGRKGWYCPRRKDTGEFCEETA